MYNNLLCFRDIHVFSKIFSFIFCLLSIFIVDNPLYYLVIIGMFYVFFQNKRMFLLELGLLLLFFFIDFFGIFLKFIFIISSVYLLIRIIDFQEVRYFIETMFYKRRQTKISYVCLYVCYFFKYYFINFRDFLLLLKSYGKDLSFPSVRYIIKESFIKTKDKINNLMFLYRYRFYNSSSSRTYFERNTVTSLDLKYVLIFVIIFLIIFAYGR